jgi:hypothetical protein
MRTWCVCAHLVCSTRGRGRGRGRGALINVRALLEGVAALITCCTRTTKPAVAVRANCVVTTDTARGLAFIDVAACVTVAFIA